MKRPEKKKGLGVAAPKPQTIALKAIAKWQYRNVGWIGKLHCNARYRLAMNGCLQNTGEKQEVAI